MQPTTTIAYVLAGCLFALSFSVSGQAQTSDGQWKGYYACGAHALRPEAGSFSWHVPLTISNRAVSGSHDFFNRLRGEPSSAQFNGHIDAVGGIRIDVFARNQGGSENFHQILTGHPAAPGTADLAGQMLNARGVPVRNCRMTLRLVQPAQPAAKVAPVPATVLPTQGTLEADRQRFESEQKPIEAMRRKGAAERQPATAQAEKIAVARQAPERRVRQTQEQPERTEPTHAISAPPESVAQRGDSVMTSPVPTSLRGTKETAPPASLLRLLPEPAVSGN